MPDWQCPRCDCSLGPVSGLVASCPECQRAYTCVTETERKRVAERVKSHKPVHGAPQVGYIERQPEPAGRDTEQPVSPKFVRGEDLEL